MARTLIVAHESGDALLLHALSEGSGHETHFACDGEQALETYLGKDIDVVVADPPATEADSRPVGWAYFAHRTWQCFLKLLPPVGGRSHPPNRQKAEVA